MSTRSLTIFKEETGQEICVMYRQMDGYPEGHGKDLKDFLKDTILVNGIRMSETRKSFNGMGCLTASVIAHFKKGIGNFYIYPAKTRDVGEVYIYTITGKEGKEPKIDIKKV